MIYIPTAKAGQDECGGVSYPGNAYNCIIDCPNDGNCTWWAYAERPDLEHRGVHGNGAEWWIDAVALDLPRGLEPLVGSIACFSASQIPSFGHVAFVTYVHDDGSFWVSEMNCCPTCASGVLFKKYTSTDQGFIYDGPVPYRQTQTPQHLINYRKSTELNDRNPYGWPNDPEDEFGTFTSAAWWFSFLNYNPHVYNADDGTAKNCYLAMNNGGSNPTAGIVYDALGGALYAYAVGWDKWEIWNVLDPDCDDTPESREGGPNSCLGMPITNSYQTSVSPENIDRFYYRHLSLQNSGLLMQTRSIP